ncbi:AraC family transcriptional regulator [Parabacteroides sp. FAFU027]|uniref:AraC family transcriptional regulator n=1 Tax=Parabacteroides sp. FAFU027 TaxID=2922715 RepID=UPI001FAFFC3B|nr:AraC family transcriptional regulator [Parabacteroides sp. FAFU027]
MKTPDDFNMILLNVGFARHFADWNWDNINSPFFRLYLVNEGNAELNISGKKYRLTPGHLYLIPPFTTHSDHCDGEFSLYYVHVYEDLTKNISWFDQMQFPVETSSHPLDATLIQRLLDINPGRELKRYDPDSYNDSDNLYQSIAENRHQSLHAQLETDGIIRQLLARFFTTAIPLNLSQDSRIIKTLRFIRENIDQKITVRQLASICCLSEDHFIRLFRQELRQTPIDYINRKKIEKAQLLMVVKNQTMKDIAYTLSFENVSYFNRLFKKMVGKTPSEYRKSFGQ